MDICYCGSHAFVKCAKCDSLACQKHSIVHSTGQSFCLKCYRKLCYFCGSNPHELECFVCSSQRKRGERWTHDERACLACAENSTSWLICSSCGVALSTRQSLGFYEHGPDEPTSPWLCPKCLVKKNWICRGHTLIFTSYPRNVDDMMRACPAHARKRFGETIELRDCPEVPFVPGAGHNLGDSDDSGGCKFNEYWESYYKHFFTGDSG